jgi:hypothetical protein
MDSKPDSKPLLREGMTLWWLYDKHHLEYNTANTRKKKSPSTPISEKPNDTKTPSNEREAHASVQGLDGNP